MLKQFIRNFHGSKQVRGWSQTVCRGFGVPLPIKYKNKIEHIPCINLNDVLWSIDDDNKVNIKGLIILNPLCVFNKNEENCDGIMVFANLVVSDLSGMLLNNNFHPDDEYQYFLHNSEYKFNEERQMIFDLLAKLNIDPNANIEKYMPSYETLIYGHTETPLNILLWNTKDKFITIQDLIRPYVVGIDL